MKQFVLLLGLLLAGFLLVCVQELIAPAYGFGGARVQLMPLLFCFGALLLPFPLALLWAVACGLLFDLSQLQVVGDQPEIALGVGSLYFLVAALLCHGVRPWFLRGYWWILNLLGFMVTAALLAMQYVLITFRRFEAAGFYWSQEVFWRIFFPAILAALLAPVFILLYYLFGGKRPAPPQDSTF